MIKINYNSFIEKINETKLNNYDCTILLFYTGEIIYHENIEIEDEENFYNFFSDLIYYIETKCCNKEEYDNFKSIINDLVATATNRKIDRIDVNFVLFKVKVLQLIEKFQEKKITAQILREQIYKIFDMENYQYIIDELHKRYKTPHLKVCK